MASMLDLPQELLDTIISHISRRDCKNLRLTSKLLAVAAIPGVAREMHLATHPESLANLEHLVTDGRFSAHIEGFKLFANVLPTFDGYAGWLECFDRAAIEKQWGEPINLPVSGRLYRTYQEYQNCINVQQTLILELPDRLRELLAPLKRLSKLTAAMWYESWISELTAEQCGGRISNFDKFWNLMKPNRLNLDDSFYSEAWETTYPPEPPSMYRSSILQARILGVSLLLPLQCPSTPERLKCTQMDLGINFDAFHGDYGNFAEGQSPPACSGDEAFYRDLVKRLGTALTESRISSLRSLKLHVQEGLDEDLDWTVMRDFGVLLNTASSLASLHLRIDPKVDVGHDTLHHLSSARMLSLRSLALSSCYALYTSQESLEKLLQNHTLTLRSLSLHSVWFIGEGQIKNGSWEELIKKLPGMVSLQQLSLYNIGDVDCSLKHGYFVDEGEVPRESGHFSKEKGRGARGIYDYVLSGSEWPGWSEDIHG